MNCSTVFKQQCLKKDCMSTLFSASTTEGSIYFVSLSLHNGCRDQWKLRGSVVLIMRCAATLRSCDICYQPSGRETRHFFFCRSNPSSRPSSFPHIAVCVRCPGALLYFSVCEKCVRVNANPHVQSNMRPHIHTGFVSEFS